MASSKGPRRDLAKEQAWRELIAGQAGSGLSVRAWCLQRGVSEASFYAWKRELARRDEEAENEPPRFVEVVVGDRAAACESFAASADGLLRICFEDVRLEVPAGFDRATLAMTLQLLRGSAC